MPAARVTDEDAGAVAAVRAFNRFYTNVIGLLRSNHPDSPYSLTEVRVLFELARQEETEAAGLRRQLVGAMRVIRRVLSDGGAAARPRSYLLRPPGPGDLGWVVSRHGALYAQEYGWDEAFERLVARIVADYAGGRDPGREAAWLAEVGRSRSGPRTA